jgi:hypothetical protein
MKIGILTYHRSHNYGALLQAIALRKVIENMGHQVTFIDYWPAYHRHMYALFSFEWMKSRKGIKRKFGYLKECIKNYKNRKTRKQNFDTFIAKYIDPYTSSMNESYDVIVHGSDQIWRKQPEINTYNPVYFGQHEINAKRRISYAASMGILPEKESDKNVLKGLLSHLDAFSVRESGLKDLVEELGYVNVSHDLDPTLLLPEDFWVTRFDLKKSEERYALYYKIQDAFDMAELNKYADSKGMKLKVIKSRAQGRCTETNIITAGPLQFLQLIYDAEIVFTSSFHGLAFSLIFHKPFFASFIKNSGRAESLLSLTGISDRIMRPKASVPMIAKEIDFLHVRESLNLMALLSMEDLEKGVSNFS